jgi:hypothetical protein
METLLLLLARDGPLAKDVGLVDLLADLPRQP